MMGFMKRRNNTSEDRQTHGRDEMNLAQWPITLLTNRQESRKTLKIENSVLHPVTKQVVHRTLMVKPSAEHGLPTPRDMDVLLGLWCLGKRDNNFGELEVYFSKYQLVHLLGWKENGESYKRIGEAVDRWMGVYLDFKKAWWDPTKKLFVTEKFHVIDDASIYEEGRRVKGQIELPLSRIRWNETFFASLQKGYIKSLDLNFYFKLKRQSTKNLFRYLDYRFYSRGRVQEELREVACGHVGLSPANDNSMLRRNLRPCIEELESEGYLEVLPENERFVRVQHGSWQVVFTRARGAVPAPQNQATRVIDVQPARQTTPVPAELREVLEKLQARGVTEIVAKSLVEHHARDYLEQQMDVFDWMEEQGKLSDNPAGWLVNAIREQWKPHKAYKPKAEREKSQRAKEDRQRREREQKAAQRRQEQRERDERQHVRDYLARLSPDERSQLEADALASADADKQEHIRGKKLGHETMLRFLVKEEVLRRHPFTEDESPALP